MQRIVKDQFARNVWSMNLEVQTEAAKQVFIKSGNINWNSLTLTEQDQAMFNILILLATTASPSRSVLIDSPYKNVPKKKRNKSNKMPLGWSEPKDGSWTRVLGPTP